MGGGGGGGLVAYIGACKWKSGRRAALKRDAFRGRVDGINGTEWRTLYMVYPPAPHAVALATLGPLVSCLNRKRLSGPRLSVGR